MNVKKTPAGGQAGPRADAYYEDDPRLAGAKEPKLPKKFYEQELFRLQVELVKLQEWASRLNADIHSIGLGQEAGKSIIYVRPEIGGSSIFAEQGEMTIADSYEIDIVRLDELISSFEKPALVKIDVQGAELGVLRGMAGGGG